MPDALGWRAKFGVMAPSTNSIVQPDFDDLRLPGVTNHFSRIFTPNTAALSNETFRAGIDRIGDNVLDAVTRVTTVEPDYLIMGISALSFFGGYAGAEAFVRRIEDHTGLKVTVGSHAMAAALESYGGIRRIGLLTPYWPVMNAEVMRYFSDRGFDTVRNIALECRSWVGIAHVDTAQCREALRKLDGDDVDALIQVGTNLSMMRLAAAAELWLGKPVIAINTATYWHALRARGIMDRIFGFGRLLEEY
ncbi:MAG: Asp/Glu racemase [Hyphomicrobiaceae bacterium]